MQQRTTSCWNQAHRFDPPRSRILIEDPAAGWFESFERFRAAGLEVAVCTGPARDRAECALLRGERCPLTDAADAILYKLDPVGEHSRAVLHELRVAHPGIPIIVEAAEGADGSGLAEGRDILPGPATIDGRIAAIKRSLARAHDSWGLAVG